MWNDAIHRPRCGLNVTDVCCRIHRRLLLSVVELKAASWLASGDTSASQQDDEPASDSQPQQPTDAMLNVIEYSDDEDTVDYSQKNFEIV